MISCGGYIPLWFKNVFAGYHVIDEGYSGKVVFKNGSDTEIVASNSVVFTGGVVAEKGAKLVLCNH